jgi:hypothetical protein
MHTADCLLGADAVITDMWLTKICAGFLLRLHQSGVAPD